LYSIQLIAAINTTRNIHKITKDKDKTAKHIVDGLQEYLHERVEADTKGLYNELLSWTLEFVVVPLNFRDEPRAKWGTTFPEGVALASKEAIPGTTRVHG
jgi:hypothetical protein